MTWFKVDDALYSHPKWLAASLAARGLWTSAGSWCAAQLTDGRIPRHVLPILGATTRHAAELVSVGLWTPTDDGWAFHGWFEFQPSAEQVEAERTAARERQRRAREKARASRGSNGVTSAATDAEVTAAVTVPPSRPVPLGRSSTSVDCPTAAPDDDPFEVEATRRTNAALQAGSIRGSASAFRAKTLANLHAEGWTPPPPPGSFLPGTGPIADRTGSSADLPAGRTAPPDEIRNRHAPRRTA